MVMLMGPLRDRCQRAAPSAFLAPCRRNDAHGVYPLDRAHHVDAAGDRPPAGAGFLHEGKALEPNLLRERRRIAAELAAVQLEAEHAQPLPQAKETDELGVPRRPVPAKGERLAHAP